MQHHLCLLDQNFPDPNVVFDPFRLLCMLYEAQSDDHSATLWHAALAQTLLSMQTTSNCNSHTWRALICALRKLSTAARALSSSDLAHLLS